MYVSKLPPKPDLDAVAAAAPASADRRTFVLALIGNLICSWSNNESLFIYVLMILLRTDEASAAVVFATLNTTRARLDLIQRLTKIRVPDKALAKSLTILIERFSESTKVRNELNHCMFIFDSAGAITHTQSMRLMETRSSLRFGERNLGGRIDPRSIPDVLQQATQLHRKGQPADAEAGYRRILEVQPKHADALHRLGQLLAAKNDFAAAKRLFRTLTMVRPDAAKAWLCLGQACEGLGQHEEALRQHLEYVRLQPGQPDGFVAVSRCMVKLGRMAELNAALLAAIEPASAPPARSRSNGRDAPDQRASREHAISL